MSESKNDKKYQRPNGCDSWDHVGMSTMSWFFENGDGAISAKATNLAFGTEADKIFTTNDGNNNSKGQLINAMFEDANSYYEGNSFPTALTGNGLKYSARRYLLDHIKKKDQRKMRIILPSKEEKGGYLALDFDVNAMESLNFYDPSKCVTFYSSYENDEKWKPIPKEFIEFYKKIKKDVGQAEKGWLISVPYSDEGHNVIRTQMDERNKSLKDLPRIDRMSHKWGRTPINITLIDKNKNKYKVPKYNPFDKNYPSKKKVERGIYMYVNPSGDTRYVRKVKMRKGKKIIEKYMCAEYCEETKDFVDSEILLGEESEWQLAKECKVLICVDYPDNYFHGDDAKFPEPTSLNHRPYDEDYYISKEEKEEKDEKRKPHKVAPENLEDLSKALYFRNGMFMGSGLSHDANNIHRTQGGHGNLIKKFILYYVTLAFEWTSRTKHTSENNGELLDKYIQDRHALINKHNWSSNMIRPEIKHHQSKIRWETGRKVFHELILFKLKFNEGVSEKDFKGKKKGQIGRELNITDIKAWMNYLKLPIKKGTKEVMINSIRDKLRDDFLASQALQTKIPSSGNETKTEEKLDNTSVPPMTKALEDQKASDNDVENKIVGSGVVEKDNESKTQEKTETIDENLPVETSDGGTKEKDGEEDEGKKKAEKNISEREAIIKMMKETLKQAALKYPDQVDWCDFRMGGGSLMEELVKENRI